MSTSESKVKSKKSFLERLEIFLEFEGPKRKNIDDPKHELRRLFSEILGTRQSSNSIVTHYKRAIKTKDIGLNA